MPLCIDGKVEKSKIADRPHTSTWRRISQDEHRFEHRFGGIAFPYTKYHQYKSIVLRPPL